MINMWSSVFFLLQVNESCHTFLSVGIVDSLELDLAAFKSLIQIGDEGSWSMWFGWIEHSFLEIKTWTLLSMVVEEFSKKMLYTISTILFVHH